MTVRQLPSPKWTVPGTSGGVAAGWKVFTYIPGTSTPKATYTTSAGDVANANPVVLDSRGEATIFWDGIYKVIVKTPADVTVWTEDNYGSGLTPISSTQLSLVPNYSFDEATDDVDVPDDWTITPYTNGTQTLDSSAGNQIHGAKSLKFTSAGSGGGFAESAFFPVQEAVPVSVIVAMKSSVTDVRNVIEIIWYDRAQVSLSTSSLYDASTGNPTSWTDQSLTATPPSNARYAKIRLTGCHSSDATTGSTWFDNVRASGDLVLTSGTQTLTSKTLGTGCIVPFARMQRTSATSETSGASNATGSIDELVEVDLGTVVAGDMILLDWVFSGTKGLVAGQVSAYLQKKSGTATVSFDPGQEASPSDTFTVMLKASGASETTVHSGMKFASVTGDGTLVLKLSGGMSGGSPQGSYSSTGCGLRAIVLR